MLPDEYQIDEATCRRMEKKAGAPLPEGALEALHRFETENHEFSQAVIRRGGAGPEFT